MWTTHPAGRCPRCFVPVLRVVLADGRRYLARADAPLLVAAAVDDDPHDRPRPHEPECPGVPPAEVAFAEFVQRVTTALTRITTRLERLEQAQSARAATATTNGARAADRPLPGPSTAAAPPAGRGPDPDQGRPGNPPAPRRGEPLSI